MNNAPPRRRRRRGGDEFNYTVLLLRFLLAGMGMVPAVDPPQPFLRGVGVNLGRGNVLMAEHLLYRPDIRPLV